MSLIAGSNNKQSKTKTMKIIMLIPIGLFLSIQLFSQTPDCRASKINVRADNYTFEYDNSGQLVKFSDRNDNFYKLIYNSDGKLIKTENYDSDGELYDSYEFKKDRVEHYDEDGLYQTFVYEYDGELPTKITWIDNSDGETKVVSELIWKDGNVIEEIEYDDGSATSYKFEYDDKVNPLQVLRPIVDFERLINYAEIYSKNNIIKITSEDKVIEVPVEYNEAGCPVIIENNHHYISKTITY